MTEEQGTLETNDKLQTIQQNSPNTLESGTGPDTNANKTISSTKQKSKKKKKPSEINIESRNSTNAFKNRYRNTSRTEIYK